MKDDMRTLIKEIKSKMEEKRAFIIEKKTDKLSFERQTEIFKGYMSEISKEIKKSGKENEYFHNISLEIKKLDICETRFVIEKSYDRYDKVLELMKKYSDNFDESEFAKYAEKYEILHKILTFMIENHLGDYSEAVSDNE